MKTLFLFLSLCAIAGAAAPTDAELLDYIKNRGSLERVTPKQVEMVATRCNIDATLATSGGPHEEAKFHTYVNTSAVLPMFDPWGKFPTGSLVVKEKIRPDGKTELFTGMWKREEGYFPEVGNWEFFTVDGAANKIVERGKLPKCASCHQEMEKGDHVSRLYITPAQTTDGRIVLHSSKATAHGEKLHYEELEIKNTLGFWVNQSDWAEWGFEVTRSGTFDIHVWQGCGTGSGGSEVAMVAAGQTVRFTVEETGGFQDFKERVVGRVKFEKPGPQHLEVRAEKKPGLAVMDLRLVVLVPVKDGE